ncbi:membrane protein [Mycobacterium phage Aminay]|uniref:Membrane protein n=1 Tax=Mycobacterium phage Aminay TaxID=2250291 RepID=A0A345KV19_9CAUD|nr:membrane protein [Mycobacterium phage Aminay]AXH46871.1 membrane protein [Mycobacterium phage Aminay]
MSPRVPNNRVDRWWSRVASDRRIDHGPMYVFVTTAMMLISLSLMLVGPVPKSSLAGLSEATQDLLAIALFLGSATCFNGLASGTRFWRPKANKLSCYQLGIAGTPAVFGSLVVYGWATIAATTSWVSAVSGVLPPAIALGAITNGITFWLEVRRIRRNMATIRRDDSGPL